MGSLSSLVLYFFQETVLHIFDILGRNILTQ